MALRQEATLTMQTRQSAFLKMPTRQTAILNFPARQTAVCHTVEAATPPGVTVVFSTFTIAIVEGAVKFTWYSDTPVSTYYAYKAHDSEDYILATEHPNLGTFHQDTLTIPVDDTYDWQAWGKDITGAPHYSATKQFTVGGSGTTVVFEV